MNQYSWLQKKLHQFALSSRFMREISFDYECSIYPSKYSIDNHVFITGLARSGTTILLNSLYLSNQFSSLTYSDMPFVLAPNLWSKVYLKKSDLSLKERAHGDGIKYSLASPEAFEEVFWKTFNDKDEESINNFKVYINNITNKNKKERYLSKNNQNIRRIELIAKSFPKSKILIPFREPIQHCYSLLSQHKKFLELSKKDNFIGKYMKWIGHTEFGPNYKPIINNELKYVDSLDINHWIEQWFFTYKNCINFSNKHENINLICYEKLCSSKKYWIKILEILKIMKSYDYEFIESKKFLDLSIDKTLKEDSHSLYVELSKCNLK